MDYCVLVEDEEKNQLTAGDDNEVEDQHCVPGRTLLINSLSSAR
jgi:hypothetical protein